MKSSLSSFVIKAALSATALVSILNINPLRAQQVQTVWFIYFENRNWTQTTSSGGAQTGATLQQIQGSANAPYINSLVTSGNANAAQVSYCSRYHHVLAGPTGPIQPSQAWAFTSSGVTNLSIHPSEPNYVWQEAGLNLSKYDDNDPYGSGASVQQIANYYAANPAASTQHLTGLLQAAGVSWKTYQEGIDLATVGGGIVNTSPTGSLTTAIAPTSQWTVPLQSFSGTSGTYTGAYVNPYNQTHQYNFACKHCGPLFFTDTNGSTVTTANYANSNPETFNYAPLEQLQTDLNNGTCGRFNIITPDQFNDMHTALSGTWVSPETGVSYTSSDSKAVAQGDNFLSKIIPQIMASSQYKNNGCIVIWTDETEPTGASNETSSQNDFNHTLMEIVISPLAKGNAYNSTFNYTHSSDIVTMQELFNVFTTSGGFLNDAANPSNANASGASGVAKDLTDLFVPGAIVSVVAQSEPAMPIWMLGFMGVLLAAAAIHVLPMPRSQRS